MMHDSDGARIRIGEIHAQYKYSGIGGFHMGELSHYWFALLGSQRFVGSGLEHMERGVGQT